MAALVSTTTALSLSFGYYAIPRMYNLPLKTIATFHIAATAVGVLIYGIVKKTFETEKLKDNFYQRHCIQLAMYASTAYIAWHATSLTNDPMPANAVLIIYCFDSLLILVKEAIAKFFKVELPSIWELHA